MDYVNDVRIDQDALDVELLKQASLTFKYSEYQAKCKRLVDRKKEELELLKANLDKAIRQDPEKYEVAKITEATLQAIILTQPEYQDMNNELIEARYDYDIANAAVRSLDTKKSSLENLVRLLNANYFAGPSLPRNLNQEWEKEAKAKQANVVVSSGMKRMKRGE